MAGVLKIMITAYFLYPSEIYQKTYYLFSVSCESYKRCLTLSCFMKQQFQVFHKTLKDVSQGADNKSETPLGVLPFVENKFFLENEIFVNFNLANVTLCGLLVEFLSNYLKHKCSFLLFTNCLLVLFFLCSIPTLTQISIKYRVN